MKALGEGTRTGFLSFLPSLKLTPTRASNSVRARARSPGPYRAMRPRLARMAVKGSGPLGSALLGSLGHPQSILKSASVLTRSLYVPTEPVCVACASPFLSPARPRLQPPSVSSRDQAYRASRKKRHVSVRSVIISCTFTWQLYSWIFVGKLDSQLDTPLNIFDRWNYYFTYPAKRIFYFFFWSRMAII